MFGGGKEEVGKGSNSNNNNNNNSSNGLNRKQYVMSILNDPNWTTAQKQAYCFDEGICDTCGIKTHWIGLFKRRPYTNEMVYQGICRTCHADQLPKDYINRNTHTNSSGSSAFGLQSSIQQLGTKTTTALTSLQSNVIKGMTDFSDSINKFDETGHGEPRQQQSQNTKNVIKDVLKTATEKTEQLLKAKEQKRNQQQLQKKLPVFHGLKTTFSQASTTTSSTSTTTTRNTTTANNSTNDETTDETNESILQQSEEDITTLEGKFVTTPFGTGQIVGYRPVDMIYTIQLQCTTTTANQQQQQEESSTPIQSNAKLLYCKKESFVVREETIKRRDRSMALNEAYESLEKMRRLNLEVECQDRGIAVCDFDMCTTCLLNPDEQQQQQQPLIRESFPRIRRFVQDSKRRQKVEPCLFCAAPSCTRHSCPAFRKESITACQDCVKLFEPEYIVDCVNAAHSQYQSKEMGEEAAASTRTREQQVDHMIDLYDRVLLLLQYSRQYMDSIAAALEEDTKTYNNINMGSSSAGIVSGALGIAAAASIFTPAGPPLLVASILLGGGATAVQTGTEVVNYCSEPNKFADRIIALSEMLHNLLRVKDTLREVLTARLLEEQGNPKIDRLKDSLGKLREVASTTVLGGVALGAVAGASAVESAAFITTLEVGAVAGQQVNVLAKGSTVAGRQANMLTKGSTALARGARFARFAGGALCAATMALEAKSLASTIKQIEAENPCEKADNLRRIAQEIPLLPTSDQLDEECRIYMGAMSNRVNANSLEDAIHLIERKAIAEWQITKAGLQEVIGEGQLDLAESSASILDGEDECITDSQKSSDDHAPLAASLKTDQEPRLSQSVRELPGKVETHKEKAVPIPHQASISQSMTQLSTLISEDQQSALLERIQRFKMGESSSITGGAETKQN